MMIMLEYIPANLDEAIGYLLGRIKPKDAKKIGDGMMELSSLHHTFGMSLRNNWGLWHESLLAKWFMAKGIWHADDMSGIILESTQRRLRGYEVDLDGQIKKCLDWWERRKTAYNKDEAETVEVILVLEQRVYYCGLKDGV